MRSEDINRSSLFDKPPISNPINMSARKDVGQAPLKSALKKGSKGTVSLPTSSTTAPKGKGKVTIGKASKGKGKAADVEEEDEDDFDGESNASGFSGGEDDLDLNDEFDVENMEVDAEGQEKSGEEEDEETDTEDEIDAMYDSKKKSKANTSKHTSRDSTIIHSNTSTGIREEKGTDNGGHLR